MAAAFGKQTASRIFKAYNLTWTSTGAGPGSIGPAISASVQQVRVISPIGGYITIDNLGTTVTSAGTVGTFIAANTANGDYFTCTPGEFVAFASTSTSTALVNVSEMA